jgi:Ca-activated chloride channel family protein
MNSASFAAWWSEFHFLRPAWLLLLLPLALLAWVLQRRSDGRALLGRFCDPSLLPHLLVDLGARARRRRLLPFALAGVLAILALAGPTAQRLPQPVFREQAALVVMLDLSRSMNAQDLRPSRLARARFKLRDLLERQRRGQTALVVYAERAFVVAPLTNDVNTLVAQLEVMEPALMPAQGSDPEAAVGEALALLEQAGAAGGELLLVTDGLRPAQRERIGAALAGRPVRLSVLGAGTAAGAPVPDDDGGFVRDAAGNMVVARLDAAALGALAADSGGVFAPLAADDRDVAALAGFLAGRATGEVETDAARETEQWLDLGPWLLAPVLPLAALAFRRGVLLGALPWSLPLAPLALLLLTLAPPEAAAVDWWLRPDQAGLRAFEREAWPDAAARFADPAWQAAARYRAGDYAAAADTLAAREDAESLYNRGNALARLGRYDEALEAWNAALEQAPGHADAQYNKSLVEDLMREQAEGEQPQDRDAERKEEGGEQPPEQSGEGQGEGRQEGDARQGEAGERESDLSPGEETGDEASEARESDAEAGKSRAGKQEDAAGSAGNAAVEELEDAAREAEAAAARNDAAGREEEALAAEQWLRQVPDDPGGLWRRKFRLQYQQRYGGQTGSAEPW